MSSASSRTVEGADGNINPESYILEHCKFYNNQDKDVDIKSFVQKIELYEDCLLYTSPSPRDRG